MRIELPRTERIDGTDYVVGSSQHQAALIARDARLDAAYLTAHHRDYEEAMRALRDWQGFRHRHDASMVAFFGTQLVFMRARVERVLHEKLKIREFLPVETGYPRGAQSYGQQVDDIVGEAQIGRLIADDAPPVDVESSVDFSPFVWVYSHYSWSDEELDAANYAGVALLQRKAEAVAEVIARKLEQLGRSGSAPNKMTGFFNNPTVTMHTFTFGEHTSSATAAEIMADLFELEEALIGIAGDNVPEEYALLVPTTIDARYRQLMMHAQSDLSVAEWFTQKSRLIKRIVPYRFLDTAVAPDVAASDAPMSMVMPVKPGTTLADIEHVLWPCSVEYEEAQPVTVGYRMKRRAQARYAAPDFRHPKLFAYVQNND